MVQSVPQIIAAVRLSHEGVNFPGEEGAREIHFEGLRVAGLSGHRRGHALGGQRGQDVGRHAKGPAYGHRAAGREVPPPSKALSAPVRIDDAIRDAVGPATTEDAKLFQGAPTADDFTRSDPWRVMRIMGEFIEGFDKLAGLEKAVTVFGSARTPPEDPQYKQAELVGRLLAEHAPSLKEEERAALALLSDGSIGRALDLSGRKRAAYLPGWSGPED